MWQKHKKTWLALLVGWFLVGCGGGGGAHDPANKAPVAKADTLTVTQGGVSVTINVLANDSDADGDTLHIKTGSVGNPTHGGSTVLKADKIQYTPPLNYSGVETFSYTVYDGYGGEAKATVTVTIKPVHTPDVLSLSSTMGKTWLENVLIPNKKSTIQLDNLTNRNIKVYVMTHRGKAEVSSTVSLETQRITLDVPADVIQGNLVIQDAKGTIFAGAEYRVMTIRTPYIQTIIPEAALAGETTVVLEGANLPSAPLQVVFADQNTSLTQTVTPLNGNVRFVVPKDAISGNIYLRIHQIETNRLHLSVKKEIQVHVTPTRGIELNTSDIRFVFGLEETKLDANSTAKLAVENGTLQYIIATVKREGKVPAVLSMATVLPDTSVSLEMDTLSTATTWVMMGLIARISTPPNQWQELYDQIHADAKVQALATYIETLQKTDFDAWATRSDATLSDKLQEALTSVMQASSHKALTRVVQSTSESIPTVVIHQVPENGDIYVDDYRYILANIVKTDHRLNNGSVNIVNDTRLFLSVEARNSEDGEIVNGYSHYDSINEINTKSLIGPKGWFVTGFSSLKELNLHGTDAMLEIVVGSHTGETTEEGLSDDLMVRTTIHGVFVPILNQALSSLLDTKLNSAFGEDPSHMKRLISGLTGIYDGAFLFDLQVKLNNGVGYGKIAKTILIDPLYNGLANCADLGLINNSCKQTLSGIAKVIGIGDTDDVLAMLMRKMASAFGKKVIKGAIVSIPWIGQAIAIADLAYEGLGAIANTGTVGESFVDMATYPREINADVNFTLGISDVDPHCAVIPPDIGTQSYSFALTGSGFTSDDSQPSVSLLGNTEIETDDVMVLKEGTEMLARFPRPLDFIANGSQEDVAVFAKYPEGLSVMYSDRIRVIDPADEIVFLDSIEPAAAYRGATVALKGCGWVPLDDIKVFFSKQDTLDEYVQAEVLSSTNDTIEVKVPNDAKSGTVYVTAGNKVTRKLLFDINPFSLDEKDEEFTALEGDTVMLTGENLAQASRVYLIDHTGKKVTVPIDQSNENSLDITIPEGLAYGKIQIYAEGNEKAVTNAITIPMVPKGVDAHPLSQSFLNSIKVTLSQEDNVDIFYRIDKGEEQKYTEPITLNADEAEFMHYSIYTYARVTVDDINYTSNELEYQYTPIVCNPDEEFVDGECKSIFAGKLCPLVYDAALDDNPDSNWSIVLPIRDKDGDGHYEDNIYCGYTNYDDGHIYHSSYKIDAHEIFRIYYYESGAIKEKYSQLTLQKPFHEWYRKTGELWFRTFYNNQGEFVRTEEYYVTNELYREYEWGGTKSNALIFGYINWISGGWKQYFKNGKTEYELHFSHGRREGMKKQWYESENIRYEVLYDNDSKKGWETYYYDEEGKKSMETYYIDTFTIDGIQTRWYRSGQVEMETPYSNDKINGVQKYYTSKGCLSMTSTYDNGVVTNQTKYDCN